VHLKPGGAAFARAGRAALPAWHSLTQVAVGPDPHPVPAWQWRSRWQRRAAVWGLAVGTAAAVTGSVVYVTFSAAAMKTFDIAGKAGGKIAPPQPAKTK
jgi:anti-sigma factor RsiW